MYRPYRTSHLTHHAMAIAASLFFAHAAWAQAPEAEPVAQPASLEEAHALRARAEVLRGEAGQRHLLEQDACYKKFLVYDCLDDVKKRYTAAMLQARSLDQAGRDFEREAQRQAVDAKEAARAAESPQRDAAQQSQSERYHAEEAGKAAERERKLADKARQAEEGRRKTAAEQAARRQKLEQRAKEDAERAARKSAEPSGNNR